MKSNENSGAVPRLGGSAAVLFCCFPGSCFPAAAKVRCQDSTPSASRSAAVRFTFSHGKAGLPKCPFSAVLR